jgi:hypothetical protein
VYVHNRVGGSPTDFVFDNFAARKA